MVARYALKIAWNGTAYSGWQRQANATTVQQVVEEALGGWLESELTVVGASRTDAGVHSDGQVAQVDLPREIPARALARGAALVLPRDVRVVAAARVDARFRARKDAVAKEYRYRLYRQSICPPDEAPFAWHVRDELDLAALAEATAALVGRRDLAAFALAGGSHRESERRLFAAAWEIDAGRAEFRIVGEGFLRGSVRGLVGTLVDIARGRFAAPHMRALLAGAPRSAAGRTAPAHGLRLARVDYPTAIPWES